MEQQIIQLVQQGLYRQNLLALMQLCDALFVNAPAVYGSLLSMFRLLEQEYERLDAIDTVRYDAINKALQTPLIDLINSMNQSAGAILNRLDAVMHAFHSLS